MATELAPASAAGEIMESVLLKGDLSKLTAEERASYYNAVCKSVGLNPLTRPLEYITLQGKLTLYARRDCADQLRKINGISIQIVSRELSDGLLVVHARATDKTGRTDEDFGAVSFAGLKGDVAANAILKCITKAKRRVTLSISGMGFLDETEVETIPDAQTVTVAPAKPAGNGFRIKAPNATQVEQPAADAPMRNAALNTDGGARGEPGLSSFPPGEGGATPPPPHDPATGEVLDGAPSPTETARTRLFSELADMDERQAVDAEYVAWWPKNIAHIKALGDPDEGAIRKAFTAGRERARKAAPEPAFNQGG